MPVGRLVGCGYHLITHAASHQYVIMCNKSNFDGFYFRSVTLPETVENNARNAISFFLQHDLTACVAMCITAEDFGLVSPVKIQVMDQVWAQVSSQISSQV